MIHIETLNYHGRYINLSIDASAEDKIKILPYEFDIKMLDVAVSEYIESGCTAKKYVLFFGEYGDDRFYLIRRAENTEDGVQKFKLDWLNRERINPREIADYADYIDYYLVAPSSSFQNRVFRASDLGNIIEVFQ